MKYPSNFKKYVGDVLEYCRAEIYHSEYSFKVGFSEESVSRAVGTTTTASIEVDDVYLDYYVTIYPVLLEAYNAGDLRTVADALLHELCHLLTAPLQALAIRDARPSEQEHIQDVVERQTERTKNVIASLLPKNWWKPENLKRALA